MSFLRLTPKGVKELRQSHPLLADAELPDTHTGATVRLSNGRALGYAGTCKQRPRWPCTAARPQFKPERMLDCPECWNLPALLIGTPDTHMGGGGHQPATTPPPLPPVVHRVCRCKSQVGGAVPCGSDPGEAGKQAREQEPGLVTCCSLPSASRLLTQTANLPQRTCSLSHTRLLTYLRYPTILNAGMGNHTSST